MFFQVNLSILKGFYLTLVITISCFLIILNIFDYKYNFLQRNFNSMLERNVKNLIQEEEIWRKIFLDNSIVNNECFQISYTTVVSLYFPLNRSKHSLTDYSRWTRTALMSIEAPLVLFTTLKFKEEYTKIRPNNTLYLVYENHWELLKEIEQERMINYADNYTHKQHSIDPEKNIHVSDLYVLWNSKPYITAKIARVNPFKSSFIIYSDLGAWRHPLPIRNWPDNNFVRILNDRLKQRLLFGQISNVKNETEVNIGNDHIEGTFFAGSPKAIMSYSNLFYDVHDKRLAEGFFIGKDQTIMNYIAFKTISKNYVRLRTLDMHICNHNKDTRNYYDPWFFYQYYFSVQKLFNCSYEKRLSILTNL